MLLARRARYRVWQFWKTVTAGPLNKEAWDRIRAVLSPAEIKLFGRMPPSEQQHGYRVMRTLQQMGQYESSLLAAGLLHDLGKSRARSYWWDRPLVVLANLALPGRSFVWSGADTSGWSRPFVIKARHAAWGAEAAKRAGSDRMTVALIRHHHDQPEVAVAGELGQLLRLLQQADELN